MIKKIFFILLFSLGIATKCSAYYDFDSKLESAYNLILEFRFDEATQLLNKEKTEKPGNDLCLLYFNYIDFLKAYISEEKPEFDNLKRNSSERLSELNSVKENYSSPFHLYVHSEILIQRALVRLKFNELIASASDFRKAYKLIQENKNLFPDFLLNLKISGLLNTILGTIPAKYQWVVRFSGMDGDITTGLNELNGLLNIVKSSKYKSYNTEILFYLGNIFTVFSVPMDTTFLVNELRPNVDRYPLIAYAYSNIMSRLGKNDEAFYALDISIQKNASFPFTYLYYKRGLTKIRKLDPSAKKDFEIFINDFNGLNNIKSAYQKLAWISLIEKDTTMYLRYMKDCLNHGVMINEDDRYAMDEAKSATITNIFLLRARLYFDGGYYNEALSEITKHSIEDFPSYRDKLEVTYRLGRILQMNGHVNKAIEYFETTIRNGESSEFYFAANSALMLGLIYEERSQPQDALKYFYKCLSINQEEYKSSIDQKALAGIERIKKQKKNKP